MDDIAGNLNNLLTETPIENLWLLTSGQLPHNPSELLGSHKLKQLTEYLLEAHDILIFDSPPALAVTDPVVLGRSMDGVIIVVDAGKTRELALRHVLLEMEHVRANIVGIVLNRYRHSHRSSYYYYDRYYYRQNVDDTSNTGDMAIDGAFHSNKRWLSRYFSWLIRN